MSLPVSSIETDLTAMFTNVYASARPDDFATNCGFFTTDSFLDGAVRYLYSSNEHRSLSDLRADNSLGGGVQRSWLAQRRPRLDAHATRTIGQGDRLPAHRPRWLRDRGGQSQRRPRQLRDEPDEEGRAHLHDRACALGDHRRRH